MHLHLPMKRLRSTASDTSAPTSSVFPAMHQDDEWFGQEELDGQLAVDVFQTPDAIIIKSPIAGVLREDLDVAVNRDVVTIRGRRRQEERIAEADFLFRECYWGGFSRSIILPMEVQVDKVAAEMKNGILTVTLPKTHSTASRVIPVAGTDE